ncbi:MAG: 50S ribosomal protein L3 [Desulfobacteraceae bacterium]|jgi:large subunit ribosomal protein L3
MSSKGLIGKKLGMTSVFTPDGRYLPVTVVQVGPCVVTQIKTKERDGYNALQLGFGEKKASRTTKPLNGHFQKSGGQNFAFLKEVGVDDPEAYELGQTIGLDLFEVGERVDVIGTTKGRGFSGVMKRHGFGGGRKTHGSKCHRVPGSIGCSAWPSKVIKGKKLPGHFGVERKTARNLEIVDIRPEENLILLKGPIPGHRQALVTLNKLKFVSAN